MWISHGGSDISVSPLQSDVLYARLLDFTDNPEWIHYELYPSCKHADDRLYGAEEMDKIHEFLAEGRL